MAFDVNRLAAAVRECVLEQDTDKHLFTARFSSASPLLDLKFALGKRFKDCAVEVVGSEVLVTYTNYALDGAEYTIRRMRSFIEGYQEGWKADESRPPMPDLDRFFVIGHWTHRKKDAYSVDHVHASDPAAAGYSHAEALASYKDFNGVFVYQSADAFVNMEEPLSSHKIDFRNDLVPPLTLDILVSRGKRYGQLMHRQPATLTQGNTGQRRTLGVIGP